MGNTHTLPIAVPARAPVRKERVEALAKVCAEDLISAFGLGSLGPGIIRSSLQLVEGVDRVPREGPVLVVSNHPGLADAVALFATMPRDDLRVIAAERPFLSALPNTSRALIPVPDTPTGRPGAVRVAARHLRRGGAVITFPGGKIEPDPAVLPGASEAQNDR